MRLKPAPRMRLLLGLLLGLAGGLRAETDLEQARRLMKARDYPAAQGVLERAVLAEPRSAEAWALLGELQFPARNPKKAQECADKAIQLDPTKARYQVLRGNALGMQAQQANVLKAMTLVGDIRGAYEKAIQLEPRSREARVALFNYYFNAPSVAGGGLDKAKALAEQTLALDAALGHFLKGVLLQKEKNPGGALAEYRQAQAADPGYAPVYNRLGYLELEQKQVDLALEHFRKQVELTPDDPNSYDSLGDGLVAKGRLDEAIQAYRKALALNPTFTPSMRSLGKALEQAGRRDEAIAHYRACAQLGTQQGIPQAVKEAKERLKALGVRE